MKNNPKNPLSLSKEQVNSVMALYSSGQIQEAIDKIKALNNDYPNVPLLFNLLGACYISLGQLDSAAKMFETAIAIKSDYAEAHFNLGVTFKEMGQLDAAVESYKKAVAFLPNYPEAHNNLGNVYDELGQREDAIESYEWAIAYKTDYAQAHYNLGSIFSNFEQMIAVKHFQNAIAIDPNYTIAHFNLARSFRNLGFVDDAIKSYGDVIAIEPDFVDAHKNLSAMKKFTKNDSQISTMQSLIVKSDLSLSDRISLNFALAKVNEDLENHDELFKFLHEGNQLRKKELNYSIDIDQKLMSNIKKVFKSSLSEIKKTSYKPTTISPIFIVGMPRSGTSLVEQIISNHQQVFGAGELDTISKLFYPLIKKQSVEGKNVFTQKTLLSIRQQYLDSLASLNVDEKFITDKMPMNFRFIGYILSAFPEAKIVHMKRDPVAICWSIYKNYFKNFGHGYSHNFEDLVAYYSLYEDLMAFWREFYPSQIYDMSYENLTTNQEVEIKKLLEYCGLEWDENCLNFHTNDRAVRTRSALQVRKKMYQGSSDAWKKYEAHLKPLINGLSS